MEHIQFFHTEYSAYLQYVLKRSAVLDRLEHGFPQLQRVTLGTIIMATFKETVEFNSRQSMIYFIYGNSIMSALIRLSFSVHRCSLASVCS